MKEILNKIKKIAKLLLYVFLFTPIYGYLTFYFVYPTIGAIPLSVYGWIGLFYVLYSIIIATAIGIFIEEPQEAFGVMVVSSIFGYILGLVYQSFPAYIYGYVIYTTGFEYFQFISLSWFLFFFYIIIGIIGIFLGGYVRDRLTYIYD